MYRIFFAVLILAGSHTWADKIDQQIEGTTDAVRTELKQKASFEEVQRSQTPEEKQRSCNKVGENLRKIREFKVATQADLDKGQCANPPAVNVPYCNYHKKTMEIIDGELSRSQPVWDRECKSAA
ncbi:MAG: hypothetical protein AB7F86_15785 [Bdellovibrionales bacterium]